MTELVLAFVSITLAVVIWRFVNENSALRSKLGKLQRENEEREVRSRGPSR